MKIDKEKEFSYRPDVSRSKSPLNKNSVNVSSNNEESSRPNGYADNVNRMRMAHHEKVR
jgi:hypothetical protein